jgi:hypothetical protein
MRITNDGSMVYCRWSNKFNSTVNIRDVDPRDFFQQHMATLRQDLLQGRELPGCNECYQMDQYSKVSGRQRQLLKTGVRLEQFEKTMQSSPWAQHWLQNYHTGVTDQMPQDWQIDLGNYCNSACVFCSPGASSRLAAEWKKIGLIRQMPPANWTDDPALVQKFVDVLLQSQHVQYIHFIGGETVITPAFKVILKALIATGLHRSATIGFTTNLTVWNQEAADLLCEFSGVNLGMSVEAFDPVNDYVRWPSDISQVIDIRDRWVRLGRQQNWLMQLRVTPTMLTISRLLSVYKYAYQETIPVESCNFLQEPEYLRPSVLPQNVRQECLQQLQEWAVGFTTSQTAIINTRAPGHAQQQILQDLQSYVNYLKNEPDESFRLPEAVTFLKKLEASRNNSVLDYLPEYEQLFRSAGY